MFNPKVKFTIGGIEHTATLFKASRTNSLPTLYHILNVHPALELHNWHFEYNPKDRVFRYPADPISARISEGIAKACAQIGIPVE